MFSWESLHSITVGGVAPHVTELAAALQRRGHEVHIFTRRAEGQQLHEERRNTILRLMLMLKPSSPSAELTSLNQEIYGVMHPPRVVCSCLARSRSRSRSRSSLSLSLALALWLSVSPSV